MRSFHGWSALAGAAIAVLLIGAGWAMAQTPAAPVVAPPPPPPLVSSGLSAPAAIQALAADTLVTVKDHGESQTIIVYKVDAKGTARLTHKAKFFY